MHLELLFLTVFALPNASRTGFDCNVQLQQKKLNFIIAMFMIRVHIVIKEISLDPEIHSQIRNGKLCYL